MTRILSDLLSRLVLFDNPAASLILKYLALLGITGGGLWFAYGIILNGAGSGVSIFLGMIIAVVVVGINIIFLRDSMYPLRWFAPGLALMALMVLYPVGFTSYVAFTNYGTGNLLTQEQVVEQITQRTYLPEEGGAYMWTAFRSEDGDFLLWLQGDGQEGFLVREGAEVDLASVSAGPLDDDGIPTEIPGYDRLARAQTLRYLGDLDGVAFGSEGNEAFVRSMDTAAQVQAQYVYDAEQNTLIDQETGAAYTPVDGRYTSSDGDELLPGYYVTTGGRNFYRLLDPTNSAYRGPFLQIFVWTFIFAVLVVVSSFVLGLFLAIVFNDPTLPGRRFIQSALVIPYATPAFISVQVWRGLLNPEFGIISQSIARVFGNSPPWFSDPLWAKIGVLLVVLWLSFPYMFLICTGALQAIPGNLYEAARIDGANIWQQFVNITLPLLLVAVGPLLIASFAYNFNNFTVIDVYNEGGPPIPNSATPAGSTDILISYVFRIAFSGARGVDYGYASAITIMIFFLLAALVAYQFRYTRILEEISENV